MSSHDYHGRRWEQARALALRRTRHRCEGCGGRRALAVHHLDEQGMTGRRAYDQANLTVLCAPCHKREHGGLPPRD